MIYPKLSLRSVFGGSVRTSHDSSIIDQYVEIINFDVDLLGSLSHR
jgi:hypothetical protein